MGWGVGRRRRETREGGGGGVQRGGVRVREGAGEQGDRGREGAEQYLHH